MLRAIKSTIASIVGRRTIRPPFRRKAFRFEPLEPRLLLSADPAGLVVFDVPPDGPGGPIVIDDASHLVLNLTGQSDSVLLLDDGVPGNGFSRLEMQDEAFEDIVFRSDTLLSLTIRMGGGNDFLLVGGLFDYAGSLTVEGGPGADSVSFGSSNNPLSALAVDVSGEVSSSRLAVAGHVELSAGTIRLGGDGGFVQFGSLTFDSPGHVSIVQSTAGVLTGSNHAGSLRFEGDPLSDAPGTTLVVDGTATFFHIETTLGDHESDYVSLGSLNVFGGRAVQIGSDTDVRFTGENRAPTLAITSSGSITQEGGSSITTVGNASFSGSSVALGATDLGSLTFHSTGAVDITQFRAITLAGDNSAESVRLSSFGSPLTVDGTLTTTGAAGHNNLRLTASGFDFRGGEDSISVSAGGSLTLHALSSVTGINLGRPTDGFLSDIDIAALANGFEQITIESSTSIEVYVDASGAAFKDSIAIPRGTVVFVDGVLSTAAAGDAGSISLAANNFIRIQGAIESLGGAVSLSAQGVIDLRGSLDTGAGAVSLAARNGVTLAPTAVINVDIGGRDAGQFTSVTVSDALTLGGTLDVDLVDGFAPAPSEHFRFLTSGTRSGAFAAASLPPGFTLDASSPAGLDAVAPADTIAPSVTINQAVWLPDPGNFVAYSVEFSEPVSGFGAEDVSLAGSTVGGSPFVSHIEGSGASYTVVVSGMTGTGTVLASIGEGAAVDAAGNASLASTSTDNTFDFDDVRPSVTIEQAAGQVDPTSVSTILFDVHFSEPVYGFDSGDLVFLGSTVRGNIDVAISGSGADYTVAVSGMSESGLVVVAIAENSAFDLANNPVFASTSIDNTVEYIDPPVTVTVNQAAGQADPTPGLPVLFDVHFSEPVTGFDEWDVFGGTTGGLSVGSVSVTGSGADYVVALGGLVGNGDVFVYVVANAAKDSDGHFSLASTSTDNQVTFIDPAPTVTINQAAGQADPAPGEPILFDVHFSEAVTQFDHNDIEFHGSTVQGSPSVVVSGSGADYTVAVMGMLGNGNVVATVKAFAAMDAAGQFNLSPSTSADNSVAFIDPRPTVTIDQAPAQGDPAGGAPIEFAVHFSEAVSGFDWADVSLAGSTVDGALYGYVSGSGADYLVSVFGMENDGLVVASIGEGAAVDAAGQANFASTSTDNTVAFVDPRPAVTIDQAATQADPANGGPIEFTVHFSEPVWDFTAEDVSFAGSTVGGSLTAVVTGSGADYTVQVSGMLGDGVVVASIPAGVAADFDVFYHLNRASTSIDNTVTFTDLDPTVTIDQAAAQADPTEDNLISFTVHFSEMVSGFGADDISFAGSTVGGTLTATVSGSGADYTVLVSGMSGDGVVAASVVGGAAFDAAGQASSVSTSTDNVVSFIDPRPRVTIDQAPAQADPAASGPIEFTVHFSEAITGFTATDISFAGSTVGGTLTAEVSGSGADYTVLVTGMLGNGVVVASIGAAAVQDLEGNGNFASTSTDNTVEFVDAAPAVTINQAAAQVDPAATGPIEFTVHFSEAITGFAASDISFAGSTAGGTLVATVTGSGADYTVLVSGMTTSGTVVASIAEGAAQDAAGQASAASTSMDNSVEFKAPQQPKLPDLVATVKWNPDDPLRPGDHEHVKVTVSNVGIAASSGPVKVKLYASKDGVFDPAGDILLDAGETHGKLKPGKSDVVTFKLDLPKSLKSGNYVLLAVVDPGNDVREANESNNVAQGAAFDFERGHGHHHGHGHHPHSHCDIDWGGRWKAGWWCDDFVPAGKHWRWR